MKPVRLILKNFSSFRGEVEINFKERDLFAIVGPTGSGKSSILDGIVFALYGKTPRFSNPNQHIISQGEKNATIVLEWLGRNEKTGSEQLYRIERNIGSKSTVTFKGQLPNGEWMPVDGTSQTVKKTNELIEGRVGLKYEEFCSVVFLPQGKFSTFLQGTGKERRQVLGTLFNSQELEAMQKYASSKQKEFESVYKMLLNRLDSEYQNIDEDVLKALQDEHNEQQDEMVRLSNEQGLLQTQLNSLQIVQQLQQELNSAQSRLQNHLAKADDMADDRHRAAEARKLSKILPLRDNLRRAENELKRASGNLDEAKAEHEQQQEKFNRAGERFEAAQAAQAQLEPLQNEQNILQGAQRAIERLRSLPTPEATNRVLEWSEEAYAAAQNDLQAEKDWQRKAQDLQERKSRHATATMRLQEQEAKYIDDNAKLQARIEEGKAKRQALDALEAEIAEIKSQDTQNALAAYAHLLKEGEPCPLCGSVEHPKPLEVFDNTLLVEMEKEYKTNKEDLDVFRENFKLEQGRLQAEAQIIASKREELAADMADLEAAEAAHQAAAPHHVDSPAQRMNDLVAGLAAELAHLGDRPLERLSQIRAEIASIQTEFSDAQAAYGRQEAALLAAQNAISVAEKEAEGRQTMFAEAKKVLEEALKDFADLSEQEIGKIALPEEEIVAIERRVATWESASQSLQESFSAAEAKLTANPSAKEFSLELMLQVEQNLKEAAARLGELGRNMGALDNQIQNVQQKLSVKADLQVQLKKSEEDALLWKGLNDRLKNDAFPAYKMAMIERKLLTAANHILSSISEDRYQLRLGKEEKESNSITVVDSWQADGHNERDIKTLSGGETFLASLSLAVALSDFMAHNKTTTALFLDEGFGTLDPLTLEAVKNALENLKKGGRMIGIVTHVDALSRGMPALVVAKGKAGSSVTFQSQYYPPNKEEEEMPILQEELQPQL